MALQSGSSGNCIYVESGGVRLLFDAGISGVVAERRLAAFGRDMRDVDAVIISHDHSDHVGYAGVFHRKYGLPLFITSKTLDSSAKGLGKLRDVRCFRAGETIRFGSVSIESIPTPHDSVDGLAFVVQAKSKTLGILTDLGHVFDGLEAVVSRLDAVFLESNYDKEMLSSGRYPLFLKRRIHGPGGHISNRDAAELLKSAGRLKWACLSHLSEENNDPELALRTHREILNSDLPLYVASRYRATGLFHL